MLNYLTPHIGKFLLALTLAAAMASLPTSDALAQPAGATAGAAKGGPISISADRMTSDDNSRIVTFSGRVITRQDDLIITCDLMRVHYQPTAGTNGAVGASADDASGAPASGIPAPPPQPGDADRQPAAAADEPAAAPATRNGGASPLDDGQEIYRIDCEGSVRIQQNDRLAVGQKALYLARSQPRRLILTGDARVWENGNSVTGHQVIYYLDQNRSQVESQENQRVRAFIDEGGNGQ